MQDYIFANMLSQEIAHDAQRAQDERYDPDQLYRYERWASTDRGPGLISRSVSFVRQLVMRRNARQVARKQEVATHVGSQCLPQA